MLTKDDTEKIMRFATEHKLRVYSLLSSDAREYHKGNTIVSLHKKENIDNTYSYCINENSMTVSVNMQIERMFGEIITWLKNSDDNQEKPMFNQQKGMFNQQKAFVEEDFTKDELMLLRMAFKLVDEAVELQRENNYDTYLRNESYSLKNKLGIYELIN